MDKIMILSINPGSTSTKIGLFENENCIWEKTLRHSSEVIAKYSHIADQFEFRKQEIIKELQEYGFDLKTLNAIVGRGGLLSPIPSGTYPIDQKMVEDSRNATYGEHASNLGCLLAYAIAQEYNIPSYIVDPPVVDDLEPLARISGLKELPRTPTFHALNIYAIARKFAKDQGKQLENLNLIITHLGGGISVAAIHKGKAINANNALSEGPFTPERAGQVPLFPFLDLCFSGKYTKEEIGKMLVGKGGFVSYCNTNNAIDVERETENGSEYAKLIFQAMAYQVSQEIGARATNLFGKVDAIILTGGMAHSTMCCEWIKERVSFIAPVYIYAGENELEALALAAYRMLQQ
ncbi:MAG TPA: butyrate kinase [Planctomycetota bacterium]|jgi:butyrate kinase|nr:butyrate kinase [Planctomycetota bacterium]HQB00094.1 butyrate kinase [Planctomycetota bacterium]